MNYPDFLMKPYEVHACEALRPSDGDVYAVIYWFGKMRGEVCIASNETIAHYARIETRSVRASLERLEDNGFILREYSDKNRKNRKAIHTCVNMSRREERLAVKPKKEPSKESQKETIQIPDWINKVAWETWVNYQKEKGKSLKPTTIKFQLKMLEEHKQDHIQIIKNSIQNGWIGLFPLKKDHPSKVNQNYSRISDNARAHEKRIREQSEERERIENAKNNERLREMNQLTINLTNKLKV